MIRHRVASSMRLPDGRASTVCAAARGVLAAALLAGCGGGEDGDAPSGNPGAASSNPGTPSTDSTGAGTTSSAGDDELSACGLSPASAQVLPVSVGGTDSQFIMSLMISGQDVFYSSYFEVYRTDLGDSSGSSWEVLSTVSNRYFVTADAVGLLAAAGLSPDLVLAPRGAGSPRTQALSSPTAVWQSQYDPGSNSLYGRRAFFPTFSYFTHDLATGQEQEFATSLAGGGSDDWFLDGDDIIVLTASSDELVPSKLYRLPKGGTEATPIETGMGVKFSLLAADANYFYLDALAEAAGFQETIYRLPRGGGSAVPLAPDPGEFWTLHTTPAATFLERFESMGFSSQNTLYRVGPSASDAANPEAVLSSPPDCGWVVSFTTESDIYVVVQPSTTHYLIRLPLADLL